MSFDVPRLPPDVESGLECTYRCLETREGTIPNARDGQRQTVMEPDFSHKGFFCKMAILNNERECRRRGWGDQLEYKGMIMRTAAAHIQCAWAYLDLTSLELGCLAATFIADRLMTRLRHLGQQNRASVLHISPAAVSWWIARPCAARKPWNTMNEH